MSAYSSQNSTLILEKNPLFNPLKKAPYLICQFNPCHFHDTEYAPDNKHWGFLKSRLGQNRQKAG